MTMIEYRMNFEAEQLGKERNEEFDRLVAQRLEEVGGEWSIEKMVEAINWASEQQDPDLGELKYELDPES